MAEIRCLFAFEHKVLAGSGGGTMHRHSCTEIVVARAGSGVLFHDDQRYKFGSGAILMYQPSGQHRVEQSVTGWHLCLGVIGCGATEIPPGVYTPTSSTQTLCKNIREALGRTDVGRLNYIELLSGMLILEICKAHGLEKERESKAQQIRRVIDTDFAKELSLVELAERVYVSPDYLRQLFHKEFGIGPIHYLLRRRINAARELLALSDATVGDVSQRCGFNDVFYFSRAFRKQIGCPPSVFRQRFGFKPAHVRSASK